MPVNELTSHRWKQVPLSFTSIILINLTYFFKINEIFKMTWNPKQKHYPFKVSLYLQNWKTIWVLKWEAILVERLASRELYTAWNFWAFFKMTKTFIPSASDLSTQSLGRAHFRFPGLTSQTGESSTQTRLTRPGLGSVGGPHAVWTCLGVVGWVEEGVILSFWQHN